jgi:hypothetical protein
LSGICLNWLNRFCRLPLRKRKEKKKKKKLKCPYTAKAFRHSLSFHKKHICLTGYIGGQKFTPSEVPIHASSGVLPLAMQTLLVTLIELFLNYKPSTGRGEPGTWVTGHMGKSK